MSETADRLCLECSSPLRGRLDKKFCNDYCRNAYNNRQNADANNFVRTVNNALRRNRRILDAVIKSGEEMGKVSRAALARQGFDFGFHTHQYTNKKGQTYTFCYEYGVLPLEADLLLVVRRAADRGVRSAAAASPE